MNHLVRNSARLSGSTTGLQYLIGGRQAFAATVLIRSQPTTETNLNLAPKCWLSSDTDFKPSEELAKERYDLRASEDIEKKRARLLYQSRKRGMLENGVILASFANKYLCTFDAAHLDQYDKLINLPTNDWDIYYWATKTKPTPPDFETPVMGMLREHLKSKVSNEGRLSDSVLGKANLDDIVLPAIKKYDLEIDVSKVDLTNYKEELFNNQVKKFRGQEIKLMTQWRKRFFEHRLKRVLSSPTALKHLDEKRELEVYSQGTQPKQVTRDAALPKDLISNDYERAMKHHEFMQFLLTSQLTDDALEYDDEAEAWANMLWHRNYGTIDDKIAPSNNYRCTECSSALHCCDTGLQGYVPKEVFVSIGANDKLEPNTILCQRCKFHKAYDACLDYQFHPENYANYLRYLSIEPAALIIVLVDLTDFPGSIWEGLVDLIRGRNKQFIIVGNKLDLLPYDGTQMIERVTYSFRKNLQRLRPGNVNLSISDSMVLSARTGFGVDGLVSRILSRLDGNTHNVYLIGNESSGKSTLFNALLQSDLCAIRKGDLLSRVSKHRLPGRGIKMLKFPINNAESWEVEMKKHRSIRVERNTAERIYSLAALSKRRQESIPHIASLINRLEFDNGTETALALKSDNLDILKDAKPRFTEDHPMANIMEAEPLSATEKKFEYNAFFYLTPSATHTDQIHDLISRDEKLEIFPNETIVPRKYSIRPLQTIFIAGVARLDLLTSQSNAIVTIFASKYLPIHVVQTKKADQFYNQFIGSPYLGVPFGSKERLAAWPGLSRAEDDFHILGVANQVGAADVVFSSFGWALVNLSKDQECIVRAYTPEAKGIFLRNPPLLSKANAHSMGKKIRDTPVFENPNYTIKTRPLESRN